MPTVEPADMEPGRERSDATRLVSADSGRQGPRGRRILYVLIGVVVGSIILVAFAAMLIVPPAQPESTADGDSDGPRFTAPPGADNRSTPPPAVRAPDGRPVDEDGGDAPQAAAPAVTEEP